MKQRVPKSAPRPPRKVVSPRSGRATGTATAPRWQKSMREVLDAFRAEEPTLARIEGQGSKR